MTKNVKNEKVENKTETVKKVTPVKAEKAETKKETVKNVTPVQTEKVVYIERPRVKFTGLSIVLFVLAAVLGIYSVYVFVQNYIYITKAIAEGGLDMSAEFANVVKYFVDGSATYIIYAVILSVLGVFHNMLTALKK